MKILIVFNQPAPYKVNLFNELNKLLPIEVIFERQRASNRDEKFYASNQYNFTHYFLKKGAIGEEGTNTGELVKILKKNQYDLIIMNGYSHLTEIRAIRYLNKKHIPWVLFINGGLIKKESKIKRNFKAKIISTASYYFSPCKEADKYLTYYKADPRHIYHYPNSTIFKDQILKKPLSDKQKAKLREELNLPQDEKLVVCPCQFIERKNNIQLIRCFKKIDGRLLLIGSGPLKDEYIKYCKENRINNVTILNYKSSEELLRYYQACNCFITLSKEDIYGHTTNEAMSQGLPVISSKHVVSSLHLIKDGVNGYLVNLKDRDIIYAINSITSKMNQKALDSAKLNTLEESARIINEEIREILKQ